MTARLTGHARIGVLAWLATVATSVSLFPLFQHKGYLLAGAAAGLVVTAVGIGLRSLRAPAVVVVLAQIAALVEWAVLTRASSDAWYGFLPTTAAITSIRDQLRAAADAAAIHAAPVPPNADLVLLVALCIAGILVLVDLIAVGLNHVAWAGLPLLALYTVSVATVPDGVPALAFIPGAVGYVALLAAEERERVSHWGRQITRTGQLWRQAGRDSVHTGALAQSGRRIGFTAVGLAVVLPLLLPAFPERLFSSGSGAGGGDGPVSISNPLVDLRRDLVRPDDTDVIVVETQAKEPSYLRLTALDEFDGFSWRPSVRQIPGDQQVSAGLPTPPGLLGSVSATEERYQIEVDPDFASTWLPTFYPTVAAQIEGDWRYDQNNFDIVSADEEVTTAGISYQLRSLAVNPTTKQLQDAGTAAESLVSFFTQLPAGLPTAIRSQALSVTAGADTDFERAVALQDWFRSSGGFTYSTEAVAGNSSDALLDFLTRDRTGYCEQFAAAMAVLARSLHIPARVAVGFLRPEQARGDNTYVFSLHDLHSWPELYFEGVGWVRFEPTPAGRTGGVPDYTSGVTVGIPAGPGIQIPNNDNQVPDDIVNRETPNQQETATPAGNGNRDQGGGQGGWWLLVVAVLVLLLVPAAARAGLRWWRWRRSGTVAELAETAWAELRDSTRDLSLHWPATLTPRQTAASLRPRLGQARAADQALDRLVNALERARYARTMTGHLDARRDVMQVVSALRARVSRSRRWRAVLAPVSLLPDLSEAWARMTGSMPSRLGRRGNAPQVLELPSESV